MNTHKKVKQTQSINQSISEFRRISLMLISVTILICLALSGKAANVLVNPGFEGSPTFTGWSTHATETWSIQAATTQGSLIRSGANAAWMQGLYGNGGASDPYIEYAYQTIACAPGSTFSADAWFSEYVSHQRYTEGGDLGISGLFTTDANGQEDGWIEVLFLDSSNNILADYKSAIMDPAFVDNDTDVVTNTVIIGGTNNSNIYLDWIDCQVTNQYDPSTIVLNEDPDPNNPNGGHHATIINTLSSGQFMVAPAGAVSVQYRIAVCQNLYESGAPYWDDCTLNLAGGPAPSVIGNFSPDGTSFFNIATTNFTFNVQSAASGSAPLPTNPTSGIHVVVNGQDRSGSLQFSGTSTNWNVTLPGFSSNQIYTVSVTVTNSSSLASSSSVTFDTFGSNNFIVDAEDYDYNSGHFIQNPTPTSTNNANSYFDLAGVLGVDEDTYAGTGQLPAGSAQQIGGLNYRADGNVAFQQASDLQLPIYLAQSNPNVFAINLSYNNPGNWENYTRNYPAGNYTVYGRISGGAGPGVEYLNLLTSGYGTATQATNNIGSFILPNGTDWGHYMWIPLTDSYGNLIPVTLPGGQQTLQLLSGGGENFVFFMLVPFSASGLPPTINNLNPPLGISGSNVFLNITNITFSVSSITSTIATNNVRTLLNGVDVSSLASFTGINTNWNVSVPVPPNQVLTLVINATDANGLSNSVTETFDTFSQNNFTIEAEDFDFNGGQFIDNPVPTGPNTGPEADSYYFYAGGNPANVSITNIDLTTPGNSTAVAGELQNYRPLDSCGTDTNSDFVRQKFISTGNSDYYVGWWTSGTWLDYTRTFPATNSYYVYGRLAAGGAFSGTTLSLVTAGRGTTNQTTQLLGSFADANAAGFQAWHWVPMLNTNGQLAKVTLGSTNTLRATAGVAGGGPNANFYMFVPVIQSVNLTASISGSSILLKFPTQMGGSYTVLYRNSVATGSWQPLSAAISGDGTVKTVTDTIGSQRFYKLLIQ